VENRTGKKDLRKSKEGGERETRNKEFPRGLVPPQIEERSAQPPFRV
jgi:hypothetical protein